MIPVPRIKGGLELLGRDADGQVMGAPGVVCLSFGGGVHPLEVHGAAWAAVLLGGNDHAAQPRDWSAHWHRLDDAEPNIAIDVSLYLILPMVWNWHWRVYCLGLGSFLEVDAQWFAFHLL